METLRKRQEGDLYVLREVINSEQIVIKLGELATRLSRSASLDPASKDFVNSYIYPEYGITGTSTQFEKAQAILSFIQKYFRVNYERDAFFTEQVTDPLEMIQRFFDYYIKGKEDRPPIGDCDDLATLYCALAESVSLRCVFVFPAYRPHGATQEQNKPNHMACAVGVQEFGQAEPVWYIADPTSQLPIMRKKDYEAKVGKIIYILPKIIKEPNKKKFAVIPKIWG